VTTPEKSLELIEEGKRNILIDLFFCQPGFHGGGEYGKAVFRKLIESYEAQHGVQLWVAADPRQHIDGWVWELCMEHACPVIDVDSYDKIVGLVQTDRFDVFFCPAIVVYTGYEYMRRVGGKLPFRCKKTKIIGGLFDLRDLELVSLRKEIQAYRYQLGCSRGDDPESSNDGTDAFLSSVDEPELREMYQGILANEAVTKLITISEYSRSSMDRQLSDVGEKIEVLYAPMKARPVPAPFALDGIDLASDPFALVLNMARIEKNAAGAIRAFEHMVSQYGSESILKPNFKVLLVGGAAFRDAGLEDVQCRDLFLFLPHLPPEHLEYLLQQAQFLVYVSFNEGFGYPPIEAMSYGTPSLVSNCTSIPEVCGDAAIYCDPFDLESIVVGIEKMLRYGVDKERLERRYKEVRSRQESDLAALVAEILEKEFYDIESAQWPIAV
jgi:glycosyltransferase involved in cell wall biosynthesis